MSGYYTAIVLLSVAISFACCFAVVRFTKGLSKWTRWLVRAVLFLLFFPAINFNFQEGAIPVAPFIYFLTFGYRDLGPGVLGVLYIQPAIICGVGCGIFNAVNVFFSSIRDNSPKQRGVRLAGVALSLPLWFFIASCIFNRGWFDPTNSPPFDSIWMFFCIVCAVCSLISVILILISMSEYRTAPSDMVWTVWAALPVVLVMVVGSFVFIGSFFYF